jgi:uncharacterized protein (DUF1330 family)
MTSKTSTTEPDRYYQLVLLWLKDPPTFHKYCGLLAPVVELYGAGLERQITPANIFGGELERPDLVNFVYYASRAAFTAFHRDEQFQKIVHLRTESTSLASVEGTTIRAEPAEGDASKRLYLIEIARFGPGGPDAYRAYEAEAEPIMKRYGYHVQRVLRAESAHGFPFTPDLVKVAYFEGPDGMDRMHGDPAHGRIENILYPAATSASVWIIGR